MNFPPTLLRKFTMGELAQQSGRILLEIGGG